METWILIIVLVAIFLFAISPVSWGKWARRGWRDLHDVNYDDEPTDIEIRAFYRWLALEHVPSVSPDAILKFHDPVLDTFIASEDFYEADNYRMKQLKEARRRGDRDSFNTYAIYKKIISTMEAVREEENRKSLRARYGAIQEGQTIEEITMRRAAVDPMRLIECEEDFADEPLKYEQEGAMELKKSPEKRKRVRTKSAFLELTNRGPAFKRPPLPESQPQDMSDDVDYRDAIRARAEKFAKKKGFTMKDDPDRPADPLKMKKESWGKVEKPETLGDYRDSETYQPEIMFVKDRPLHYENDEAFETPKSAEPQGEPEKFEVDVDNIWGKSVAEAIEVPTKPIDEPSMPRHEEEPPIPKETKTKAGGTKEPDDLDDTFTRLIKI